MPKTEIEYLLFTDSDEQVHSFINDYYNHRDPLLESYLIYTPIDVIIDEYHDDKGGYSIECWNIHAYDIDKSMGEITYLSAPKGCLVRFSCYEDNNLRRVMTFIDQVIERAATLGFNPKLYGELPELVDVGDIQAVDPEQKQIEDKIQNTPKMKEYYKGYNPVTAKKIYDSIPQAWDNHSSLGGRWGPGYIANVCNFSAPTIGRYCKAFRLAGITIIEINGEEISIP